MNERIKRLAEQASEIDGDDLLYYHPVFAEKLAKLIIHECICALDDADGSVHHSECLLERFGVEE
jgi:hypothetical protein